MSAHVHGRVGVWTIGLARNPHLRALLGADELVFRPGPREPVDFVVGWGRKPNTEGPRRYAREHGVPFLALEDGFVRSLAPGVSGDPPLSIVVDEVGIYYDATAPSAIEQRLASIDRLDDAVLARARRAIDTLRRERISKYNDAPTRRLPRADRPRVLVVDQTAGDLSITLGSAGERPFDRMLEAALDENPDAEIVIKTHPDVALGKRRGNFASIPRDPRVTLFSERASPIALLDDVQRVYVVTSLLGLEALLSEKPVTCFGVPFYAGWGLTDDRGAIPSRRGAARTIEHLFAEAYLSYARYLDPETGRPCELERVIDHLALQRRTALGGGGHFVCVGFSAWKRAFIPSFLGAPLTRVEFASDAQAAERRLEAGSTLVVWGTKEGPDVRALAERSGAPLQRMEDGFLRSVGLGSDLNTPASLVLDDRGIYYDPRTPSALEEILQARDFDAGELTRARALRERIVAVGISKYNLGERRAIATARGDRQVVLVVGQVEDDASIRLGCVDVRTNEALLREARRARPDAYVLWKPHPDVVRGNREGAIDPARARQWADEIVADVALADCLAVAGEVHTMTSLVGFEALLRGLRVVVYGHPFYAGWGLTEDRHPHPRRTARLTLDELVAGTLLHYPRYVSAATRRFSTPERIVDELLEGRDRAHPSPTSGWAERELGKVKNLARTLIAAPERPKAASASNIASLGCTSALLLQGPAGPFMRRLGEELRDAGVRTTKINFHAGDVLFYPGPDALPFRGELGELGPFVRRVIEERKIDALFLFGDCRAHHRIAIEVANELGVTVWALEEGYLRPDWITIERGGVNGHSSLPRDPEVYRRAALPEPPPPQKAGDSFGIMSWYSTLNALTFTHLNQGFPHYRHHRNLNAWFHTFSWVRGAARKKLYLRRETPLMERIEGELSGRYFLAALQVHCDFQLVHSKYGDVVEFIHELVRTFAEHGDPRDSLIIKHHPMDRPFREYGPLMKQLAREHGLGDRLIYVHDLHLPTLLKHARGTITINSTTALQSLHHGTPVKATGTAIYDLPGLTFQGELAEFLRDPGTFDRELYESFRRWLLWHNQANGNFYRPLPGTTSGTGIRWPEKPDAPRVEAPAGRAAPTAKRRKASSRGAKLAKLRNSPERFFAESKVGVLRALGPVVAPPVARSELAMAMLEDPLEALRERDLPLLSAAARTVARRRADQRRERIARAGYPRVSVVVAGRNAEDCIERSIRSLLEQTHRELEILVVDDASTDGTADIVRAIAAEDDRVRLLRNERRRRAAMSRNVGLAAATGAFVTFQDADDTSHPERIERQLAALLAQPDAVLCVCNHLRETPEGERVVVNGRRFARNFISMMFPRTPVLEQVGYLRELEIGEDAEYYERIRAAFGAEREVHLFETLYRARFAPTSLLFSNSEVTLGTPREVSYVIAPSKQRALDEALERVESMRREGKSTFVAFPAEGADGG